MPSVHLIIKGKVQGVCYRATARDTATGLSLRGWVRNTDHGHVEVMATGPGDALQRFTDWCRHGPPGAIVRDVIVEPMSETPFPDFSIRRD